MTEYFNPHAYVKVVQTSTSYQTLRDNFSITYKPNQAQIATVYLDNTDNSLNGVFKADQRVQILIEADLMLDGFIINKRTIRRPNFQKIIELVVVDWIGYLASKIPFEFTYLKYVLAWQVYLDALGYITDGSYTPNPVSIDYNLYQLIRKDFLGSYVKDAWNDASRISNSEWFGNEKRQLDFFAMGSKQLTASNSVVYLLKDTPSGAANEIMVKNNAEFSFLHDTSQKFNGVIINSGRPETVPTAQHMNFFVTDKQSYTDVNGKTFDASNHFFFMDALQAHAPTWEDATLIGGNADSKIPAIVFKYGNQNNLSMYCDVSFVNTMASTPGGKFIGLPNGKFDQLRFLIWLNMTGISATRLELRLVDSQNSDYWYRDILPDISGFSTWVSLAYPLPNASYDNTTGAPQSNGWQKNRPGAVLNNIDYCRFQFTPSTGYNSDTTLKFSMLYFWKRQKVSTINYTALPPTRKTIVDASLWMQASQQAYCDSQFLRFAYEAKNAVALIRGNTAFTRPGYQIDVDFTTTMDSDDKGRLRMSEIQHSIHNGRYITQISFDSHNQRA